MKVVVILAASLALASCRAPPALDRRGDVAAETSEDPVIPLNVADFTTGMKGLVKESLKIRDSVAAFQSSLSAIAAAPSKAGLDKAGKAWGILGEEVGTRMDSIAMKILYLFFGLYAGDNDFVEQDACDGYNNFNKVYVHPKDGSLDEAWVKDYVTNIGGNLACIVAQLDDVSTIQKEVDSLLDRPVTEGEAIAMLVRLLQDLHLLRLNGNRIGAHVDQMIAPLYETKQSHKRLLSGLKKRKYNRN